MISQIRKAQIQVILEYEKITGEGRGYDGSMFTLYVCQVRCPQELFLVDTASSDHQG
jgi:hypothetical protein